MTSHRINNYVLSILSDVIPTDKLLFLSVTKFKSYVASVWSNAQEIGNLPSKTALERVIL